MYHGSKTFIEGYLEPRISFACEPLVYATDDYYYALVRCGDFDMSEFLAREDYRGKDEPYQLIELEPNAFEKLFKRPGYIYKLKDSLFEPSSDVSEFVSRTKVPIIETIYIDDIWSEMQKHANKYELIRFEESGPYWRNVSGGYEGYIRRKQERLHQVIAAGA